MNPVKSLDRLPQGAAALTGLAAGTPVVGGAGDNAAAAVGTGVVERGRAFTTIGTSGVVFAHSDRVTIDPSGTCAYVLFGCAGSMDGYELHVGGRSFA